MTASRQRYEFPEIFHDVMRIRREVMVRERGGELEDMATDLEGDSVSFHWVLYITDWVDSESTMFGDGKGIGERILTQIPIGTIQVRPVIGMVRFWNLIFSLAASVESIAANIPNRTQRQPQNTQDSIFIVRMKSNYLELSEPLVLNQYRGKHWVQNILVNAVIKAFDGYLPPEFFHDIFGRVIPLHLHGVRHPDNMAKAKQEWKNEIVAVMPDALRWSGLLCVYANLKRQGWWERMARFEKYGQFEARHYHKLKAGSKVLMLRVLPGVYERKNPARLDLSRLSLGQRIAFDITTAMVRGEERPWWRVRVGPTRQGSGGRRAQRQTPRIEDSLGFCGMVRGMIDSDRGLEVVDLWDWSSSC